MYNLFVFLTDNSKIVWHQNIYLPIAFICGACFPDFVLVSGNIFIDIRHIKSRVHCRELDFVFYTFRLFFFVSVVTLITNLLT